MRYAAVAAILFLAGVALTQLRPFTLEDEPYVPIVRIRTESSLFLTVVQKVSPQKAACADAVADLVGQIRKTCAVCYVESSECSTTLSGLERGLAAGDALPVHTIAATGVRIAMLGPPSRVQSQCAKLATVMASNGLPGATCVAPQITSEIAKPRDG
jgi:hypothetical protein